MKDENSILTWNNVQVISAQEAADKDEEDRAAKLKDINDKQAYKDSLGYFQDAGELDKPNRHFGPHPAPVKIKARRSRLKGILRKILDYKGKHINAITDKEETLTTGEAMMFVLVKRGLEGNLKAMELIFDRLEGKAKSSLDIKAEMNVESTHVNTNHDFSRLSTDELISIQSILSKVETPIDIQLDPVEEE